MTSVDENRSGGPDPAPGDATSASAPAATGSTVLGADASPPAGAGGALGADASPPAGATGWPAEAAGSYPGYPGYPVPPYQYPEPDRLTRWVNRFQAWAPRWLAPVAALGCIAGAVGYTLIADPTRSAPDAAPSCILKLTTGLDCPGCGGTRALWYVLHGDLPAAARHHLLFVFALPFLLYLYVAWAGRQIFGWRLPQLEITPKTIGIFLAAWGVFSVLRNLPWAPFDIFYV